MNKIKTEYERMEPLDPTHDRQGLDGLDQHWWEKLVEIRERKVEKEAQLRRVGQEHQEMQRYFQRLMDEDEHLRVRTERVLKELADLRDVRAQDVWDIEVPLSLKQGQTEVEQDFEGLSSDISDAIVVNRSVVVDQNTVVVLASAAPPEPPRSDLVFDFCHLKKKKNFKF